MNEQALAVLEARLQAAARAFPYPLTPSVAEAVRARLRARPGASARPRQWAWVIAAVALILAGLLGVPQVRAAVAEVIRIGVVSILLNPPTATPVPTARPHSTRVGPTARPLPTPSSLLDLQGEVPLAEAEAQVTFPILLPTYPADLGEPDRVYLQDQGGPMVALVWLDTKNPDTVRLSLHMLPAGSWGVGKMEPAVVLRTAVNGRPAEWTEGPYLMYVGRQDFPDTIRLIEGHVLIWEADSVTYRLETDLEMDEAVRIAESLK